MARSSKVSGLKTFENLFESFIFWSRWIQAPMYGGLVVASFLYVYKFFQELFYLWYKIHTITEEKVMLSILGLVDVTMVINLLVMVIIGGYSIFTSKINLEQQEDKPQWLEHLDAGRLKIKLAASLASISGVHLLKTFIDVRNAQEFEGIQGIAIEICIHLAFIVSALLLAYTEKIQHSYHSDGEEPHKEENHDPNSPKPIDVKRAAIAAVHAQKRAEAAAIYARKQLGQLGQHRPTPPPHPEEENPQSQH